MSTMPIALSVATAYHEAWTSNDLDQAGTYVATDVVWEAPGRRVEGIDAWRPFLAGFVPSVTGAKMIAAFGDDHVAVLPYSLSTAAVEDAPTMEYFTVEDGKIAHVILLFDRLSFAPPPAAG